MSTINKNSISLSTDSDFESPTNAVKKNMIVDGAEGISITGKKIDKIPEIKPVGKMYFGQS